MLPYIEEASDRLEEIDINLLSITIRFTDEEPLKITSDEFYDIMNNNYSRKKKGEEFFKLIAVSKDLKNIVDSIDRGNNLSNILIRYQYKYDESKIEEPKSFVKKFKDFFNR